MVRLFSAKLDHQRAGAIPSPRTYSPFLGIPHPTRAPSIGPLPDRCRLPVPPLYAIL